jgi:hypothetical protein
LGLTVEVEPVAAFGAVLGFVSGGAVVGASFWSRILLG